LLVARIEDRMAFMQKTAVARSNFVYCVTHFGIVAE
jgi:hypothetical protein